MWEGAMGRWAWDGILWLSLSPAIWIGRHINAVVSPICARIDPLSFPVCCHRRYHFAIPLLWLNGSGTLDSDVVSNPRPRPEPEPGSSPQTEKTPNSGHTNAPVILRPKTGEQRTRISELWTNPSPNPYPNRRPRPKRQAKYDDDDKQGYQTQNTKEFFGIIKST